MGLPSEGELCVRTTYEFLADGRPVYLSTSREPYDLTVGAHVVLPEGGPHAEAGVVNRMAAIGVTVGHAVEQPEPRQETVEEAFLLGSLKAATRHAHPSDVTTATRGGLWDLRSGLRISRLPLASDVPARHQPDENGNHEGPHGRCAVVRAVSHQSKHVQADTPGGRLQPTHVVRPSAECVSKPPIRRAASNRVIAGGRVDYAPSRAAPGGA